MSGRQFDKHLRNSLEELGRRRRALLDGLERHAGRHIEITDSQAGMHVVVWLRQLSYAQFERFTSLAAAKGLGLHPIHPFYRQKPPRPGLLVGFASLPVPRIDEATALFGACLSEVLGKRRPSVAMFRAGAGA